MALGGIGGGSASPLDRFQQARDLARRKLEADDSRARLAEVLKRKQAQLGGLAPDRPHGPQAAARNPAPQAAGGPAGAAGGHSAYGRAGAAGRPDTGPGLGRHIDLTA